MALCLLVLGGPRTFGTQSLLSPLAWWDLNNDGRRQTTEGDRSYQRIGTGWTSDRISGVEAAAAEWRDPSPWDPTIVTTTATATIRVDGAYPGSGACGSNWEDGDVAVNCVRWTLKLDAYGEYYYDVYDSDIGIDRAPGAGQSWNWDGGTPTANEYDFRGVMAHELGHGIVLDDEYGTTNCRLNLGDTEVITMCGDAALIVGMRSFYMRNITTDDFQGASYVY